MQPFLSIVVTSRNDFHGGDILKRMRIFVNGLLQQSRRHKLQAELIFVEWNPPADRPRLGDILPRPAPDDQLAIRYIIVPEHLHRRWSRADVIPLFQMTAKNVGIRRARGQYILCTNIDLLFSDPLIRRLAAQDLNPQHFYRANRCDVPADIDEHLPVEQQLDWCAHHILRRNGMLRDFPHANWQQIGFQDKPRWVLRYSDWFARRARKKQEYADREYYLLDKEACGDFTLMHRDAWTAIQAYPELDLYSIHIDTLGLAAAKAFGYQQEVLPLDECTYHIDHPQGWSSMGGIEKMRVVEKRPGLGTDIVYEAATQLIRKGGTFDINPPDWGLAQETLLEYSPLDSIHT